MIITELKDGYAIIERDGGWYVVDFFGLVNREPLPTQRAAAVFLEGHLHPKRLS